MNSDLIMVFLLLAALLVPAASFVAVVIAVIRWLNRH
jgi:hypothetical protein